MGVIVCDHFSSSQIPICSSHINIAHNLDSTAGSKSSKRCNNPIPRILHKTTNFPIVGTSNSSKLGSIVSHTSTMCIDTRNTRWPYNLNSSSCRHLMPNLKINHNLMFTQTFIRCFTSPHMRYTLIIHQCSSKLVIACRSHHNVIFPSITVVLPH